MSTCSYDTEYSPPVPICNIEIATKIACQIGKEKESSKKVKMLIDTGSDFSIVPKDVVNKFEKILETKLPYDLIKVEDFNGQLSVQKLFTLTILIKRKGFKDEFTIDLLGIDVDEGILGRDVLNSYLIRLNGPCLTWTLEKNEI